MHERSQLAHLRYNAAVDIWSAACVLECLVRDSTLPYVTEPLAEEGLLGAIMRGKAAPCVPEDCPLHDVVQACCSFDANKRPSASVFAERVAALTTSPPPSP